MRSQEMKSNPFCPGGIVKYDLFGGRTEYILKILKKLNQVRDGNLASFYLFGERGIGKTALAKLIKIASQSKREKLYNLNFLTSYYSVQPNQSIKSALESSLNNVADSISTPILDRIGKRLGKLFNNGKFSIGAFGIEASYEKSDEQKDKNEAILIKDQFVSIVRNIINVIKNGEDSCYDGILIIIDEMDNLGDIEFVAPIVRGITTTLDFEDLGYISFLFIGYQKGYNRFVESDVSIKRLIDPVQLLEMPSNEIVETFEKGFKEAGVKWDKKSLNIFVNMTGGYPLAIQVIGHNLIETDTDNNIGSTDWESALLTSADELIQKEYSSYYSFSTRQKKNSDKIISAFAVAARENIMSLSAKQIGKITSVKNPRQYISTLLSKGILLEDKSSKKYQLKRGLFLTSIIMDFFVSYGVKDGEEKIAEITEKVNKFKSDIISNQAKLKLNDL